jgi:hypothetical protein
MEEISRKHVAANIVSPVDSNGNIFMKLLDLYSHATGLRIGHQWLLESFYPLPITRYMTLHASSGMAAKNYPYYQEVVALILNILESQRIKIVQLGGKDDVLINGCVDLRGKTDYHQSSYILRNSLCHLGNDSWLAHRAGEQNVPLITLFGPTTAANHGAYTYDAAKTVFLESHRWGRNPTFASQEQPLSIGLIPPEKVANTVLCLLGITDSGITHTTLSIGALYAHTMFDLVPNTVPAPGFYPEVPMTVRLDIHFDEQILAQVLSTGRKVNIVTKRALSVPLLHQFRAQVLTYAHEITPGVDEPPVPYTDAIRSLFPNSHAFFTREQDAAKVSALRFTYFDHVNVSVQRDATKEDFVKGVLAYLHRPDTPENRLDIEGQLSQHGTIKSNRYILSANAAYLSYAHLAANQPMTSLATNSARLIDDWTTWRDAQHFLVTSQPT